jgi:hypothetical protein
MKLSKLLLVVAAVVWEMLTTPALAQVPEHVPGTICFTQTFWCWAQWPGPPGAPCGCPGPYGYVPGSLG